MEKTEDLSKMKVADLKKQLKSRGLSVTGNKTELVERLQEALDSGVANTDSTLDTTEGEVMDEDEFDEEEILGGEEVDIGKITPQEEAAALAGNLRVKEDVVAEKPEKKKISLKRSEPCLSNPVESSTTTTTTEVADDDTPKVNSDITDPSVDKENSEVSAVEPKHKMIKLSSSSDTTEAASTKKAEPKTEDGRKEARAARFGASNVNSSGKPSKLSMETGGTDLEKLKKRAERFGEVTSKSLSKLETVEKLNKRKDRFGKEEADTTKKETKETKETKVTKHEKITVSENGSKSTDDAKTKRAERFKL